MDKASTLSLYKGVAQPWECDNLGHLTTRFYVAMFDDASYQLLFELFGWSGASDDDERRAFVDVKHVINYLDEVHSGELLEVTGTLSAVGNKSITAHYELRKRASGSVAATLEATYVLFDLQERCALALDDELRGQAFAQVSEEAEETPS